MSSDLQADRDGWSNPGDGDDLPVPSQPAGSTIEIDRFEDGVSINVPPTGLWRSPLFLFGVFWNAILVIITVVFATIALNALPDEGAWIMPAALSVFWLVGIGVSLAGINMGIRRAGLAVADGTLMVLQTGLFGKKQREWPAGQVAEISVGPTGMTVNDKPVLELQIHDADGDRLGLLAGRSDEELAWLAGELRRAAKVRD
jgi:hypothetical protein